VVNHDNIPLLGLKASTAMGFVTVNCSIRDSTHDFTSRDTRTITKDNLFSEYQDLFS